MKEKLPETLSRVLFSLVFLLVTVTSQVFAQERTVTGKILDEKDQGLPGASVTVKGTTKGSNADVDGNFSLAGVKDADILVISSIGYLKQEITVGNQSAITVKLAPDVANLEEVVVTALGVSKDARKLGYAVSTIGGEVMTKARETNVANSLAGRVAGLNVKGTSGGPGGTAKILMRGMPSMNSAGSPLIVINGVPMDNTQRGSAGEWGGADGGDGIGNLNPDDIETMTVLKGQAASALFGARASNGVIMIKTKAGKKGDFSIDYNMNYSLDTPVDMTNFQYEYGQGTQGVRPATQEQAKATGRLSWGERLDGQPTIQFDGNSYAYSAQRNNVKNFYNTGTNFTNSVAVTKGGDNGAFRFSIANLDNKSIIPNSGLDRKTFNLSVDQNLTKKLSVNVMANYVMEKVKNKPQLSDGPMNANNGMFLATNIDQRILAPGFDPVTGKEVVFSDDEYVTNPYFVTSQYINNVDRKRLISTASTKYQFADWIYAQARIGYDHAVDKIFKVTPWGTGFSQNGRGGLDELSTAQRTELNIDGLIGFNKSFNADEFSIDGIIGANLRKNRWERTSIGGSPFVLPYLYSWNNVVNFNRDYNLENSEVHSAYYSVDLSYKGMLNLTTTGRYDAYSTMPVTNNSIFTPSVTGSFVFNDLLNSEALSFGKLRASYAVTSGEFKPWQTSFYYGVGNAINGVPTGNFSDQLPNLFLKPFTKSEIEFGVELKFFGNRLGVDLAYYDQKTRNEIMPANYSPATGYVRGVVGTGSVQNRGLEVQLNANPVRTSKVNWNVSLNLTNVKNEILQTDPENNAINLGQNRATLGNAVTAFVVGKSGPQIRAYDYKYSSDGQIVVNASGHPIPGELLDLGTVLPTLYGGLNNDFSFSGINLSFLVDYNFGNKILSATENYAYRRGLHQATLEGRDGITTGVLEGGQPNTVRATAQDYYTALANNVTKLSVLDGDFIKLRQITLGYTIPAKVMEKWPLIRAIDISLVGRNLFYFMRKTDNIDPEASFGANLNYSGIEGTSLPSTRNYGVNLNFKFK